MKTVVRYQPGFVSADTSKSVVQVPEGKIWLTLATVEVIELDATEARDLDTSFTILAAVPDMQESKEKANLLRRALKQVGQHVEANKGNLHFQ